MKILLAMFGSVILSGIALAAPSAGTSGLMVGAPPRRRIRSRSRTGWRRPTTSGRSSTSKRCLPTTTVDRGTGTGESLSTPNRTISASSNSPTSTGKKRNTRAVPRRHAHRRAGAVVARQAAPGDLPQRRNRAHAAPDDVGDEVVHRTGRRDAHRRGSSLDETKHVTDYVPELKGSAYDGATLRNLMNMEIGIDFAEIYDDPEFDDIPVQPTPPASGPFHPA